MPHLEPATNVRDFLDCVQPTLAEHDAEHGLLLGLLERAAEQPEESPAYLVRLAEGEATIAVAYHSGLNLVLSRGWAPHANLLAADVRAQGLDLPGVVGPEAEVDALLAAAGLRPAVVMPQLVYELRAVVWQAGIPGFIRPMDAADVDLVAGWLVGFHRDALPELPYEPAEAIANAQARPAAGLTYLWEVAGRPVAMAALARPTRRGITVNAVYTPPEHRRHGYASALVAAVSAEGLARGKAFCTLYTDRANPTTNAMYQRLGYREVGRAKSVKL